jgi:hypothetical protein
VTLNGRIFVALTLVLVSPLLLPGHPPLLDYPNHLARARIAFEPDVWTEEFYSFRWMNVGNLGFEAVVGALSYLMPVTVAGQVFVGLVIAVNAAGLACLSLALHGRITTLSVFALAFLWNRVVQSGFMSFGLGSGLALLGLAAWTATERRPPVLRIAMGTAFCLVIYFTHILAFLIYGILIFGYELGRLFWKTKIPFPKRLTGSMAAALQAVPTILVAARGATGNSASLPVYPDLATKFGAVRDLVFRMDIALVTFILAVGAVLVVLAAVRHRPVMDARAIGPAAALLAAYMAMPADLKHGNTVSAALDFRLVPTLALVACAGVVPWGIETLQARLAAVAAVAVAFGAMMIHYWLPWVGLEKEFRACLAQQVGQGESVVSLFLPDVEGELLEALDPPGWLHLGAWAVTDRSAYYPGLFALENQQPLRYRPDHAAPVAVLNYPNRYVWDDATREAAAAFDYLLAMHIKGSRSLEPVDRDLTLEQVCDGYFFALYRIVD